MIEARGQGIGVQGTSRYSDVTVGKLQLELNAHVRMCMKEYIVRSALRTVVHVHPEEIGRSRNIMLTDRMSTQGGAHTGRAAIARRHLVRASTSVV